MAEKMCRICRTAPRHQTYRSLCLDCGRARYNGYRRKAGRDPLTAIAITAINRAKSRLAALHADDYLRLIDEERVKLGLKPANRLKNTRVGPNHDADLHHDA